MRRHVDNLSMLSILRGLVERVNRGTNPLEWNEVEINKKECSKYSVGKSHFGVILRSQAESGHGVYRVTVASVWVGTE